MNALDAQLLGASLEGVAIIVICDDAYFTAQTLNNYLWVTYTRSNPSHDIYGVGSFTQNKHWGCTGPLVIDARIKPHHAPVLIKDEAVEKNVDRLFEKGGSLYSLISTQV
jgi:4-hydroxy-3-polyprenylbenzoate decarboxylase